MSPPDFLAQEGRGKEEVREKREEMRRREWEAAHPSTVPMACLNRCTNVSSNSGKTLRQ